MILFIHLLKLLPLCSSVLINNIKPTQNENQKYRKICGTTSLLEQDRIIGGENSVRGEFPWHALLFERPLFAKIEKAFCSGVLISKTFILSAAHCTKSIFPLTKIFVELGRHNRTLTGYRGDLQFKRVVRIIYYTNHFQNAWDNDIVLLKLEVGITINGNVVPICLPSNNFRFAGKIGYTTGFGLIAKDGDLASVLQKVDVKIYENSVCKKMYESITSKNVIKRYHLCAGYENGEKDACYGDSGGPLSVQNENGVWILAGIVSSGVGCGAINHPGIYTNISYYVSWILQNI